MKRDFEVIRDGWVAGQPARAGDRVQLTERQARYETNVRPVRPPRAKPNPPAAPAATDPETPRQTGRKKTGGGASKASKAGGGDTGQEAAGK